MTDGTQKCPIDKEYCGPLIRHHIHGRDIPDWDEDWNVAYVSPNTHQMVHEGKLIIEGWFFTTKGYELIWHWTGDQGITGVEAHPHKIERKN